MGRPKQFQIKILFIAAILLLLSLSVFSYYRIETLINSSNWRNHTTLVKLELEGLFSKIKDVDSHQRGFVLTKNPIYLSQFENCLEDIARRMNSVKALTKDNYSQQRNIGSFQKILDKGVLHMRNTIKDAPNQKIPTERWLEARSIMTEMNDHINKMMNEENLLLRIRTKSMIKETTFTPIFTIFLTICSLLIIIMAYYGINYELTISNQLKSNLENNRKQLLEANQSLEEFNQSLGKVNKELEAFTYISSHDLQEPLRKIQMMISRIMESENENLTESGRTYLNRTHDSANRMQRLIMDLLAYSRVKTEEFEVENINLTQMVEEVKSDLEEEIAASNALIKIEGSSLEINVIISQFRQLLTNLISNAIKFSRIEAVPEITIHSSIIKGSKIPFEISNPDINFSKIIIEDNGIGFDSQYEKRIFELFQRLHTNKEYPGTGIGLAIVKKIVENHHGYITAESPEGKGAIFIIYIPFT